MQVNLRRPTWKMMGPIMHTPFLVAIPLCYRWLSTVDAAQDPFMYYFTAYTSAITTISLALDARTALLWASGTDPGVYKRATKPSPLPVPNEVVVLVPSLVMALLGYFGYFAS
jgi:hypothetical protein